MAMTNFPPIHPEKMEARAVSRVLLSEVRVLRVDPMSWSHLERCSNTSALMQDPRIRSIQVGEVVRLEYSEMTAAVDKGLVAADNSNFWLVAVDKNRSYHRMMDVIPLLARRHLLKCQPTKGRIILLSQVSFLYRFFSFMQSPST